MAKVAFIGLGVMGFPMAGHLVTKGKHEVTVYNRNAAKAKAWSEKFGGRTAPTLQALYAQETSAETKKAVIDAFFLQNNARALIDISKKETNQTLRKAALQKLSIMNDEEALQYMLQILEE